MNMLFDIDPTQAICFSGHRPDRLPGNGDLCEVNMQSLITAIRKQVISAIQCEKTYFLHGAMAGFDIIAAEQVIALKKQYPQIQLISIAPYSVHFFNHEKCWTPEWVHRASKVFRQHDFGISLAEHYSSGIYYERNRFLVDHSSELICFWDGKSGGTAYTVRYAKESRLSIQNLFK